MTNRRPSARNVVSELASIPTQAWFDLADQATNETFNKIAKQLGVPT